MAIWTALLVNQQMAAYSLLYRVFWADVAATVFVYLAGVLLNNATVYDPYWSVAPIAILFMLVASRDVRGSGVWLLLAAIILQGVSDRQMHRFRKERSSSADIIQTGVWKYARHPNYLAEIIFWWGIYLFLVSVRPRLWLLGFGALLNTLMFLFISIPMAEKRLAREKDGYEEYAARTRMLLPIKKSS
ncbi:MAG: DUF1295 domain-containing protein [Eubacteriales bacterium]|nr:DUF1295 domain-containing protein [Eubacteriales bacterium]